MSAALAEEAASVGAAGLAVAEENERLQGCTARVYLAPKKSETLPQRCDRAPGTPEARRLYRVLFAARWQNDWSRPAKVRP